MLRPYVRDRNDRTRSGPPGLQIRRSSRRRDAGWRRLRSRRAAGRDGEVAGDGRRNHTIDRAGRARGRLGAVRIPRRSRAPFLPTPHQRHGGRTEDRHRAAVGAGRGAGRAGAAREEHPVALLGERHWPQDRRAPRSRAGGKGRGLHRSPAHRGAGRRRGGAQGAGAAGIRSTGGRSRDSPGARGQRNGDRNGDTGATRPADSHDPMTAIPAEITAEWICARCGSTNRRHQPAPRPRGHDHGRGYLSALPHAAHHRGRSPAGTLAFMARAEITTPEALENERLTDVALRPRGLGEFVGQAKVKESLQIAIDAAKQRKEPLDHVLFFGPPGLGKTTLALLMAKELDVDIRTTSGPVLERPGDLVGMLTSLKAGDILFIDEVHRLRPALEEFLYPAMEEFRVDVRIADGPHAQTLPMQLERFTLIGATTRFGLLTPPLRARFGLVERLHYYPPDDLVQIITRSAGILGVGADAAGVAEIARRSRGTPRVANRLLKRVRDYAQVRAGGKITAAVAGEALKRLDVDEFGLDDMDARILKAIIEMFDGGPVGVQTVAAAVGEDPGTLEEVYEPFLMQQGFLARTPRGRVATPAAYRHFGFVPPKSAEQASIFDG